jgi:hypothetical protein
LCYYFIQICFPQAIGEAIVPLKEGDKAPEKVGKLKVAATSSNGNPVICYMDHCESGGRVVVDTGFTKLYPEFWVSEGQARYVVNACVYLIDVEGRFGGK